MMDEINASRLRGAIHEARNSGEDGVLPAETLLDIDSELGYLMEQVDETWAKRILCAIGGFLLGAVVGGFLTIDHLRAKAEHARPPAIVEPRAVRPHAGPGQVKAVL